MIEKKIISQNSLYSNKLIMAKNIKYELVVYWSEDDSAYIVEVPELSGCMADGRTYKEAVRNALIVIEEWIETARELGRSISTPKGNYSAMHKRY